MESLRDAIKDSLVPQKWKIQETIAPLGPGGMRTGNGSPGPKESVECDYRYRTVATDGTENQREVPHGAGAT